MSTYLEIRQQAEELFRQAELLRQQEVAAVVANIRKQMAEFGLKISDIDNSTAAAAARRPAKQKVGEKTMKYRGPNGELWAGGLGRKPEWVRIIQAEGKSIEDFRIPESA